jgi:hypothetical protein
MPHTKADCHNANCPAAGHVLQCARMNKEGKPCPIHTESTKEKKHGISRKVSSSDN